MDLKIKKNIAIKKLAVLDYFTAIFAWIIFWIYRQEWLHEVYPSIYTKTRNWNTRDYFLSFLVVPLCWLLCYYLVGTYFDLYRKSRIIEIIRSFTASIIGALLLGFIAFANDVDSFKYFFEITMLYMLTHFVIVMMSRMLLLRSIKNDLATGKVQYNTLIVGGNGKAIKAYEDVINHPQVIGNHVIGFVNVDPKIVTHSIDNLPVLGNVDQIESLILQHKIEEVIIALESHEHSILEPILIKLSYYNVVVKVLPDMYDFISGSIRINSIFQPVFITIHPELLPDWQKSLKRSIDITVALFTIIFLSPLYVFAAIKTKLSSAGPVFYKQERIGLNGNPFFILKFRSMYIDAEINGPQLSSDHDKRITPWGKFMRKWRIDEIPQFFNVLKGEMSLVGPRPERAYFINQIIQTHPHYKYLHRVKPGITSWGMVEFGYAENIQQMIARMRFDLLYIQNCSIVLDIKIIFYTFIVLLQGRGK